MKPVIRLRPVGFVRRLDAGENVRDLSLACKIVLDKRLKKALDGITGFSHLFVVFWMHRVRETDRHMLKVHPRGRKDMRLLGVYASRTAYRPNPIGLTVVKLLHRHGHVLTVQGLDALEGTPVLDIKPYDAWDSVRNAKVPRWWLRLEHERIKKRKSARLAK